MIENQMINYNDEYYICVSNAFVKANQDLNPNETKLLRLMISQVVLTDNELKRYTTTVPELAKIFDVSESNLYRDIETMSNNLMRKVIKIDYGKNKWTMFQIFSQCEYDNGILTMQLHDKMKPFLIALENKYTQYQIGKIIGMSSNYAIRIFELIQEKRQTQKDVKNYEKYEFTIDELKMATNTIDKYKKINDLKKYVLDRKSVV